MFDTVNVPCVAVVENMAYTDTAALDDTRHSSSEEAEAWAELRKDVKDILAKGEVSRRRRSSAATVEDQVQLLFGSRDSLPSPGGGVSQGEDKVEAVLSAVRAGLNKRRNPRRIFGKGHRQRLADMWGISNTASLPLTEEVSASGDSGTPLVVRHPDSPAAGVYRELASKSTRLV